MKRVVFILSIALVIFISSCTQQEDISINNSIQEKPADRINNIEESKPQEPSPLIEDAECPKFSELRMYYDDSLKNYITDITKYSYNNRQAIQVHNYTIAGGLYNKGKFLVYCRVGYPKYQEDSQFYYCDNTENSINLALVKNIQTETGTKIQSKRAKLLFDRDGSYLGTIC